MDLYDPLVTLCNATQKLLKDMRNPTKQRKVQNRVLGTILLDNVIEENFFKRLWAIDVI